MDRLALTSVLCSLVWSTMAKFINIHSVGLGEWRRERRPVCVCVWWGVVWLMPVSWRSSSNRLKHVFGREAAPARLLPHPHASPRHTSVSPAVRSLVLPHFHFSQIDFRLLEAEELCSFRRADAEVAGEGSEMSRGGRASGGGGAGGTWQESGPKSFSFTSTLLFRTRRSSLPPASREHTHRVSGPSVKPPHDKLCGTEPSELIFVFPSPSFPQHAALFALAVCGSPRAGKVNPRSATTREDLTSEPLRLVGEDQFFSPSDTSSGTFSVRVQWKAFDGAASSAHYRRRLCWSARHSVGTSTRAAIQIQWWCYYREFGQWRELDGLIWTLSFMR